MNKMTLPTVEGAEKSTSYRSVHQGRHVKGYSEELSRKMTAIYERGKREKWTTDTFRSKLEDLIKDTRQGLKQGEINLNKHTRDSLGLPTEDQK